MIPNDIAHTLHEVPEEIIIEASKQEGQHNFKKLLKAGKVFRHAGATPIFLANEDGTKFCVSSHETYQTKLH